MRGITRLALPAILVVGLTIVAAAPASAVVPTNDDFANATNVGALPFTDATVNTTDATTQATDPTDCNGAGHSVWYSYTADFDGFVAFDTFGSNFDTVLSAYTGTEGSLAEIACNDDTGSFQSRIIIGVASGTTYHVMVSSCCSSESSNSGDLTLNADVSDAPFTFDLSFSPKGSVVPKTGVATIHGTVVCSEPGYVSDIDGELQQRVGRTLVRGFFFFGTDCSEEATPFTTTVSANNGLYVAGKATIRDVFAFGCRADGNICDSEFLSGVVATVKLGR